MRNSFFRFFSDDMGCNYAYLWQPAENSFLMGRKNILSIQDVGAGKLNTAGEIGFWPIFPAQLQPIESKYTATTCLLHHDHHGEPL